MTFNSSFVSGTKSGDSDFSDTETPSMEDSFHSERDTAESSEKSNEHITISIEEDLMVHNQIDSDSEASHCLSNSLDLRKIICNRDTSFEFQKIIDLLKKDLVSELTIVDQHYRWTTEFPVEEDSSPYFRKLNKEKLDPFWQALRQTQNLRKLIFRKNKVSLILKPTIAPNGGPCGNGCCGPCDGLCGISNGPYPYNAYYVDPMRQRYRSYISLHLNQKTIDSIIDNNPFLTILKINSKSNQYQPLYQKRRRQIASERLDNFFNTAAKIDAPESPEKTIRLLMLGNDFAGKTHLIERFIFEICPSYTPPTTFCVHYTKISINQKIYSLEILDTSGLEYFEWLRTLSYPNTDVAIICFNRFRRRQLYNAVPEWIRKYRLGSNLDNPAFILVATQCDRGYTSVQQNEFGTFLSSHLSSQECQDRAMEYGALAYFETSATTGEGVREVFYSAADLYLSKFLSIDVFGNSLLHNAVLCCHLKAVRYLLTRAFIDIYKKNRDEETALDLAHKISKRKWRVRRKIIKLLEAHIQEQDLLSKTSSGITESQSESEVTETNSFLLINYNEYELSETDVNPAYFYQDNDILGVLNTYFRHELPEESRGYLTLDEQESSFLNFHPENIQRVMVLPALSASIQGEIDLSDPETRISELYNEIKQEEDIFPLRILFPINLGRNHWITGEINIVINEDQHNMTVTAHDPYGGGEMPGSLRETIQTIFGSWEGVNIIFEQSPYQTSRQHDGTSCGVITTEEIIHRVYNRDLDQYYPKGAIATRLSHLLLMQRYVDKQLSFSFYRRQKENRRERLLNVTDLSAAYDSVQMIVIARLIRNLEILPFSERETLIAFNQSLEEADVAAYIQAFREKVETDYPTLYELLFTETGELQTYKNTAEEQIPLDVGFIVTQLRIILDETDVEPTSPKIETSVQITDEVKEIGISNLNELINDLLQQSRKRQDNAGEVILSALDKLDNVCLDCRNIEKVSPIIKAFVQLLLVIGGDKHLGGEWLEASMKLRLAQVANRYAALVFLINHGFFASDKVHQPILSRTQKRLFEIIRESINLANRVQDKELLIELKTLKACIQSLKMTAKPWKNGDIIHLIYGISKQKLSGLDKIFRKKSRFFTKSWYVKIAKFSFIETRVCYESEEKQIKLHNNMVNALIDEALSSNHLEIVNAGIKTLRRITNKGATEEIRQIALQGKNQLKKRMEHISRKKRVRNIDKRQEKVSTEMLNHINALKEYRQDMDETGIRYVLKQLWEVNLNDLKAEIILRIFTQLVISIIGEDPGEEWLNEEIKLLIAKVANRYGPLVFMRNRGLLSVEDEEKPINRKRRQVLLKHIADAIKLVKKYPKYNRLYCELRVLLGGVESLGCTWDSVVEISRETIKAGVMGLLTQKPSKLVPAIKVPREYFQRKWYIEIVRFYFLRLYICNPLIEMVSSAYEQELLELLQGELITIQESDKLEIIYAGLDMLLSICKQGITKQLQELAFFGQEEERNGLIHYIKKEDWRIKEKVIEGMILLRAHTLERIQKTAIKLLNAEAQSETHETLVALIHHQDRIIQQGEILSMQVANPERFNLLSQVPVVSYEKLVQERGKELGRGASSVVYKIKLLGEKYAFKELIMEGLTTEESTKLLDLFKKEADIMYRLRGHSNVMQVHCICRELGHYGMVLDYMSDGSLYKLLRSETEVNWRQKWEIASDIAKGLHYLHTQSPPIIHGDLKSQNILMQGEEVKISDFNLSRTMIGLTTLLMTKHETGQETTGGTIAWMAPELLEGRRSSPASDMYSYGMILWELTSQRDPYTQEPCDAHGEFWLIQAWVKEGRREEIPEDSPKELSALISGGGFFSRQKYCWHQNPQKRPKAREIVTYLEKHKETICNYGSGV